MPRSGKIKAINKAIPEGTVIFYASPNWNCSYREWAGKTWKKIRGISSDIINRIQNAGSYEFSLLRFREKATSIYDFKIYRETGKT